MTHEIRTVLDWMEANRLAEYAVIAADVAVQIRRMAENDNFPTTKSTRQFGVATSHVAYPRQSLDEWSLALLFAAYVAGAFGAAAFVLLAPHIY